MTRIRTRIDQLSQIAALQAARVARDSLALADRRQAEARARRHADLMRSQAAEAEAVWADSMDTRRLDPALMAQAASDWLEADAEAVRAERGQSHAAAETGVAEGELRTSILVRQACATALNRSQRIFARKREEALELDRDDLRALRSLGARATP